MKLISFHLLIENQIKPWSSQVSCHFSNCTKKLEKMSYLAQALTEQIKRKLFLEDITITCLNFTLICCFQKLKWWCLCHLYKLKSICLVHNIFLMQKDRHLHTRLWSIKYFCSSLIGLNVSHNQISPS